MRAEPDDAELFAGGLLATLCVAGTLLTRMLIEEVSVTASSSSPTTLPALLLLLLLLLLPPLLLLLLLLLSTPEYKEVDDDISVKEIRPK